MMPVGFSLKKLILTSINTNYNMKRTFLAFSTFICLLLITNSLAATEVKISSHAPSYAGDKLSFYIYDDYFAYTQRELVETTVNDSGYFESSFNIDFTQKVFADLGIFKVHFYAEPGKTYNLVLPEKVEKKMQDKLNPYFQPVEIHLGIIGAKQDELNVLIRMYNDSYVPYFNKHVVNVAVEKDFSKLDEEIAKFTEPFLEYKNEYFTTYIKYRTGLLRFLAQQNKSKQSSDDFFIDKDIEYYNPAYMELFNQIYDQYFAFLGRTEKGKQIFTDINKLQSLESLDKTLSKDKALSDKTIREMVILKNIYDEFYSNRFSRSALVTILDSLVAQTDNDIHKKIGKHIKNKITRLLSGYAPPDFALYDQDSNLVVLSELEGNYVYLNFCASHSYSCIQEYEALKYLYEKHKERIKIITVSTDASFNTMAKSRKQMNCPWTFVYYGDQSDILEKYDIRAFPTYFLIGKDGKLIRSPAPSPGENIEKTLFEIMRARGDI